uniref:tRNA (cytosine(34)-C(5))-methyltransferase n=1 Tax=Ditylenchus dipsaci TaxID=166011 RepID=A0A915EQ75_9BILA
MSCDPSERTIYVKNLDDRVDKETLEELFVQVGSVVSVFIKEHATPERAQQQNGQPAAKYAFVEFQDEESVLFAIEMLNEVTLFGRQLMISPRDKSQKADQFRFLQQRRNSNNFMGQDRRSSSYVGQAGVNSDHRSHSYVGNNGKRFGSTEELHSCSERMPHPVRLNKVSLSPSVFMLPPQAIQGRNSYSSNRSHQDSSYEQRRSLNHLASTPTNHRKHPYHNSKNIAIDCWNDELIVALLGKMDASEVKSTVKIDAEAKQSSEIKVGSNRKAKKRSRNGVQGKPGNYELNKYEFKNENMFQFYKMQNVIPEEDWQKFGDIIKVPLPSSFRIQLSLPERDQVLSYMQDNFLPSCQRWKERRDAKEFIAVVRSHVVLRDLHEFLVNETTIGNTSRQEAVSMVPPLLLDIQSHHLVLDACAAPGSKTMQIIELMHQNNPNPEGLVVANDLDYSRCYLLVHQTLKRMPTANCVVINQDASMIPAILDAEKKPILFDRILCDVIADGTFRKNPELWASWDPQKGLNLHKIQQHIARRCLQLLAVGGLMVYSTCSLNPMEDEAVLAYMLRTFKGCLELVDVSDKLPSLKRSPGLSTWKVIDKSMKPINSHEDVPNNAKSFYVPSMFPPTKEEAAEMHLERSFRILPHAQNSGGFFVAVIRKVAPLSEELNVDQPFRKTAQKKRKTFREDPFVFLGDTKKEFTELMATHYGLDDAFPFDNLLIRTHNTEKKKGIYYVNDRLRDFLKFNAERFKIVNAGVGVLRKVDKISPCGFRLMQDGIRMMIPYITKRMIKICEEDIIAVLKGFEDDHYVSLELLKCKDDFAKLECGSVVLKCSKGSFQKYICAWMGAKTVSAFISREEKIHCLNMLGADTSKLRKCVLSVRQGKAAAGRIKHVKEGEDESSTSDRDQEEIKEEGVDFS